MHSFYKGVSETLKNMQQLGEVDYVTLVSDNNEKIRAHKVVLASVSIPSGTGFRLMTRMHIMSWSIYQRSILEYNGECMVKEKYCEDFMKIKIFQSKSTDSYKGTIL